MVLTTHAVVGGALAAFAHAGPAPAFALGFLSHFLLDAIPHWDYFHLMKSFESNGAGKLGFSVKLSKSLMRDILFILTDISLGLILVFLFFLRRGFDYEFSSLITDPVIWGALGAMFPDFLQLVYSKFPREPFKSLQKFAEFIHADPTKMQPFFLGFTSQVVLMAFVIYLALKF